MSSTPPQNITYPFVAAAAVEEGLVSKDTLIDCENGRFRIGRNTISDEHPEKVITVSEVIKVSSNIGAAKLAFNLGADRTIGYLKDFGFSRPTNLGLSGEASGRMQNPATINLLWLSCGLETRSMNWMTSTIWQEILNALKKLPNWDCNTIF